MSQPKMERLGENLDKKLDNPPSLAPSSESTEPQPACCTPRRPVSLTRTLTWAVLLFLSTYHLVKWTIRAETATGGYHRAGNEATASSSRPYGILPFPDDPFLFIPCTNATVPPALDDPEPAKSWGRLYDPNPAHWSWGNVSSRTPIQEDPYSGRGIYLCGYYDVPLDWTNQTGDTRIARLAVAKYQVAGLVRADSSIKPYLPRTNRTIVIEPGGPGGSGTSYVWRAAEAQSSRLSNGTLDVLGWDPRGVNASLPAAACFPHDADRDRWELLSTQHRNTSGVLSNPMSQLEVTDAWNEAVFAACAEKLGDLPRFLGTGQVASDLDAIREALDEPLLTGYLVSYGTGIGQTYAQMFPDHVGWVVLDGTEFVPDQWALGGFGWTSLDNVTDAYRDGFLGGCVEAGPKHCALAAPLEPGGSLPTALELEARMAALVARAAERPIVAYTPASGPSLIAHGPLVDAIYSALYRPQTWPGVAAMLSALEQGNATLAAAMLDRALWMYNPDKDSHAEQCQLDPAGRQWALAPSTVELTPLVICADAYDAPPPGLDWYDGLWANMTARSWISGNSRFYNVLPCRHFTQFWPAPAGVYRGPLNHSLANPILLVAESYDPATPLRNGRRLARAMGYDNARLVVHHGFGHASMADPSTCTDAAVRDYILNGTVPFAWETHCLPDEKPYLHGVQAEEEAEAEEGEEAASHRHAEYLSVWRSHIEEMGMWNPRLARHWQRQRR